METIADSAYVNDVLAGIQAGCQFKNPVDELHLQTFRQSLERAQPLFDTFLEYRAKSEVARKQVQSCTVQTKTGPITLDQEPDVAQILLLSDELALNELDALEFVIAARNLSDEVSASSAAGVFFERRFQLVKTLELLLQTSMADDSALPPQVQSLVKKYIEDLLRPQKNILHRLLNAIQSEVVDAAVESRIKVVVDSFGRTVDRSIIVQREKTALCECLLYAAWLKKEYNSKDFLGLLDTLHHLTLRFKQGHAVYSVQMQAIFTMGAALLAILPVDGVQGDSIQDKEIENRVASLTTTDQPYSSLIKLTWGLVVTSQQQPNAVESAAALKEIAAGIAAGALRFASSGVLRSVPMLDEPDDVRELVAFVVFQIVELVMEYKKDLLDTLLHNSETIPTEGIDVPTPPAATNGALVVSNGAKGNTLAPSLPQPDTLSSLLGTVGAAIETQPLLAQKDPQRAVVGDLLQIVGEAQQVLSQNPGVFLAFIKLWISLAGSEEGSKLVFNQLRSQNALPTINWHQLFDVLLRTIRVYTPSVEEDNQPSTGRRTHEIVLPQAETMALCAYVDLFTQVMTFAPLEEMQTWLRQLEAEAGISPVWEVLFQGMCAPVPQALKASLDGALTALARRQDIALPLWERLLSAVVIQRTTGEEIVARYDLTYQLNEIEARSEDYQEALAFIRLLNALWKSNAAIGDTGAHFTRFVREDILGTVASRRFRDETQRWELIAVALEHCELCIRFGGRAVGAVSPIADSVAASKALSTAVFGGSPSNDIMRDLATESYVARAALFVLHAGTDVLAEERYASVYGASKEAAALAALSFLRAGLDVFTETAATTTQPGVPTIVDTLAMHDRRRLALLMDYVRYPHNMAIQKESIKIAAHLAMVAPNLVPLLQLAPSDGAAPIVYRLQDGYASCLRQSMITLPTASLSNTKEQQQVISDAIDDSCAALVLHLLLTCLEQPPPNLTHLLCGYDLDGGMGPLALLGPLGLQTPLTAALDILMNSNIAAAQPRLYEQCQEVVYYLAAGENTGPSTLELLFFYDTVLPLLNTILSSVPPMSTPAWATHVHQRAWLLQLLALQLKCADIGVAIQQDYVRAVLAALFSGPDGGLASDTLLLAAAEPPPEPQFATGVNRETQRMIQALDLHGLMATTADVEHGGVCFVSGRGEILVDVVALKDELLKRHTEWAAQNGQATEALKQACHLTLKYAQEHNAYVEKLGAQVALLDAWQAVLTAVLELRFEELVATVGGLPNSIGLLMGLLEQCLRVLPALLHQHSPLLALPVSGVLQAAMAKLHDQLSAADVSSISTLMPHPHRCHAVLDTLLQTLWEARAHVEVRMQLYNMLVTYLKICQGPALLQLPPTVLEGVMMGDMTTTLQEVESLQDRLEHGNSSILAAHTKVLSLLLEDAVAMAPQQSTVALTTVSALVATDPTTSIIEDIYRSGLITRLLQELPEQLHAALTSSPPEQATLMLVVESQLTLIVRLALAGSVSQRGASAQRLTSLQVLPCLTACAALDLQPEEPGFDTPAWESSFRERLRVVLAPAFRLVLAMLSGLPDSAQAREQAASFVDAHARTLARVLHDAVSIRVGSWQPKEGEVELATLVAQLLAELAPHQHLLKNRPQLQEAAFRAATNLLCGDKVSQSDAVAQLAAARLGGVGGTPQLLNLRLQVLSLKCALCSYLQQLSQQGTVFLPTRQAGIIAGAEGVRAAPSLAGFKDGLLQAAMEELPDALNARIAAPKDFGSIMRGSAGGQVQNIVAMMSQYEALVFKLFFLVEMLLAVIFQQLRNLQHSAQGGTQANTMVYQDGEQLCRMLEPALIQLQQIDISVFGKYPRQGLDLLLKQLIKTCGGDKDFHRQHNDGLHRGI